MSGPTPITCPLCSRESSPAFIAGAHRMYRCHGCRAAFVFPRPTDAFLAEFYNSFHQADEQGGMYDGMEQRMQADFPAKVGLVQHAFGGKPGRLLDVGCGKGFFVKECVKNGLDAEGVDLSDSGVRFAKEKLGVKATQGLLSDLKSGLGLFDVVTFWATIEHLPDPIATLRDMRDVLKPGGKLLLDTGIGDDWLDRLLPGRVQWYDPPQHLFVFSNAGMKAAIEKSGFRLLALNPSFERSPMRRWIKLIRNGGVATMLRIGAELGRMKQDQFAFTRFPVGNLMSVVAERVG